MPALPTPNGDIPLPAPFTVSFQAEQSHVSPISSPRNTPNTESSHRPGDRWLSSIADNATFLALSCIDSVCED
jgi:hypothetical protein